MPRRESWPRQRWIRSLAVLLAALLGLAGVCLVVFGTTQKQLQIGVLLGLWAALIGAFLVFGARRGQAEQAAAQLAEAEQRARELHEAQLQVSALQQAQFSAAEQARGRQEVELRKLGEVQLSREVAARREADLQLELSLRREIERMMNEQIGLLRNEVAALRAEVVDKLGGQLRLERIETTRLIGSDLEALQHEIRRLAGQEGGIGLGAAPSQLTDGRSISVDTGWHRDAGWQRDTGRRTEAGHAEIVEAELVDRGRPGAVPSAEPVRPAVAWSEPTVVRTEPAHPGPSAQPPYAASAAADGPPVQPGATPKPRAAAAPPPAQAPPPAAAPSATAAQPAAAAPPRAAATERAAGAPPSGQRQPASDPFDLFAALPRLSAVPEDLELIPDRPPTDPAAEPRVPARTGPGEPPDGGYGEQPETGGYGEQPETGGYQPGPAGYHGRRRAVEEQEPPSSGGRRRAPDDAPDDLFARLRRP